MRALSTALFVSLSPGCFEPEVIYEVEFSGEISSDEEGPIEIWLLHRDWGEGTLNTPYRLFDQFELESPGRFQQTILVPLGDSNGLSVYGWQDINGDGEHCRPGSDEEPSGIVHVDAFPEHHVEINLDLDTPCKGPEAL